MMVRLKFAAACMFLVAPVMGADRENWPSFHGPNASGISKGPATPKKWNLDKNQNVRWRQDIAGLGLSSPVVWGDQLIVTTAVRAKGEQPLKTGLYGDIEPVEDDSTFKWMVVCLDKTSGKVLWEETACEGVPKIKRHTKASHANSTPATDGQYVVACFGSEGLYCYDMKGKLQWKKDLGVLDAGYYQVPEAQWGFGSSPIIHDGKVFLQCDVQKDSFVAAYDVKDGRELWRTPRDEVPTWSSPTICTSGGKTQLVLNGYKHIGGYDPATGKEIWKLKGGGDIPVPTPIVADDLIYITNAHGFMAPVYAIRPTATGDITPDPDGEPGPHVAWWLPRMGNYMQTMIAYKGHLYSCMDSGVLTCFDAKTGEKIYRKRIGKGMSGFTASGVCQGGKLYYTSEDGDVYVVKAGPNYKLLATNSIGGQSMATPAISDGVIYFRTNKQVIAIGKTGASASKK